MEAHGGNIIRLAEKCGCRQEDLLDFSANINPLGPPPFLHTLLTRHIPDLIHYPDPACTRLTKSIGDFFSLDHRQIVAGNGTSELLFQLPPLLQPKRALIPVPAYVDYDRACNRAGIAVDYFPLSPESAFQPDLDQLSSCVKPGDLVILGQPNNPTGRLIDREQLLDLIHLHPDTFFIIDEAFAGFVSSYTSVAGCADNVIVLYSLTKIFAIPGLRLGFLAASSEICCRLQENSAPWRVNTLAQVVGEACLTPNNRRLLNFSPQDYLDQSCCLIAKERAYLLDGLSKFNDLHVFPSSVNYLLLRSDNPDFSGTLLAEILLRDYQISIRPCTNYQNLDQRYFRIAVRSRSDNKQLLPALRQILHSRDIYGKRQKIQKAARNGKKPALMLLGTGSDVGKSVLVAALGRILLQDGIRVAPFKAQNMSLNSYVTRDGAEMGRAQVVQAQACRLDPDVRMNPILLKPSSDVGSQVIVLGKPVGNMMVREYVQYKETVWQVVCKAYDSLADEYQVMLLEGAGSPGEVNLKSHDIVNTRMARYAEAAAVLVGDIDRGGVYASFIGHFGVMEDWERRLLAGFVVNRFRGDARLLADAHDYLQAATGKSVFGVIEFIPELGLPQEDSVGFKAGIFRSPKPTEDHVEVILIDLPHISNFTDIEPLLMEADVHVRIVSDVRDFGEPDAVIIPGSKNVPADLNFLRASGFDHAIHDAAGSGIEIVGICGGFQILGRRLTDPHGLETSSGASCRGLGLLDMETELAAEKTLIRKQGLHLTSGCSVHGYEIHHGISRGTGKDVLKFTDGTVCGLSNGKYLWGTYLHGIFDADGFRRWWINRLRLKKGLKTLQGAGAIYDLEPALDRLADLVRDQLDMDAVYHLLGL